MLQAARISHETPNNMKTKLHGVGSTSDDDLLISGCWNMVLLTTTKIKG